MVPIFVKRKEVTQLVGLSAFTIDKLEKEGKFPKRVQITEGRVGWRYTDILDWSKNLGVA